MLTDEQKSQLKSLLDSGVLTPAEYDKKVNPPEPFNKLKLFKGLTAVADPVEWSKTFHTFFNIRAIIVYLVIAGSIYGYGYIKGLNNKPVHIDGLSGKEAVVEITKDEFVNIHKDGTVTVQDAKGKTLKTIRTKDIPVLQEALKPIGLQLNPIFVGGYGVGGSNSLEFGGGFSIFKFYKLETDAFITNKGYYIGESYRLEKIGKGNTSIGLAVGKGYTGDSRILGYIRWEF